MKRQGGLSRTERAVRIELARSRAALERRNLQRHIAELGDSLQPRALVSSFLPAAGRSTGGMLLNLLQLTRRYPLLLAGASTLLSAVGRRRRWMRMGLGLLLSWGLARKARNPER